MALKIHETNKILVVAILKSINENFDNLPDEVFWTKQKWTEIKQNGSDTWFYHTRNLKIRHIPQINEFETLESILNENIEPEKSVYHLNLIRSTTFSHEEWNEFISKYYSKLIEAETFNINRIQYFKLENSDKIIQPFDQKISFIQRIRGSRVIKIQKNSEFLNAQLFTLQNQITDKPIDSLLKQARVKNEEKYLSWVSKLDKTNHNMTDVIEMGHARVRRNHYSVNSNFNKSGKLAATDENLILIRRKFGIFGLSLFSLLPLLAFVRPASKLVLVFRIFMEYLRIPLQLLKGLRPVISASIPVLGGLLISTSFINVDDIMAFFDKLNNISFLSPISFGFQFFAENPEAIPVAVGLITGMRFLLPTIFKRAEEIVILPHDRCKMLITKGNELIGRWEIKGSDLVNAKKGIQYRFSITDYSSIRDRLASKKLAMNIFHTILGDIPKEDYIVSSDKNPVGLTNEP